MEGRCDPGSSNHKTSYVAWHVVAMISAFQFGIARARYELLSTRGICNYGFALIWPT